jgi:hypothetical protein
MVIGRRIRTVLTVAQLVPVYLAAGLLKHVVPLPTLARWAWKSPSRPADRREQLRLVACVVQLNRTLGALDRDCLQRSLLLYRVLSGSGANPELCVGLSTAAPRGGLRGHAWVTVEGTAVLDEGAALAQHQQVACFGDGGRRIPSP